MRNILILLIRFIFILSKVDATSINESFLEGSHGIICLDLALLKDFF